MLINCNILAIFYCRILGNLEKKTNDRFLEKKRIYHTEITKNQNIMEIAFYGLIFI